jgi:hypothetical protein
MVEFAAQPTFDHFFAHSRRTRLFSTAWKQAQVRIFTYVCMYVCMYVHVCIGENHNRFCVVQRLLKTHVPGPSLQNYISAETFLQNIFTNHFYKTFLQNIFTKHFYKTFLQNIFTKHFCKTTFWKKHFWTNFYTWILIKYSSNNIGQICKYLTKCVQTYLVFLDLFISFMSYKGHEKQYFFG